MPTQTELEFRSGQAGQTQNAKLRALFEARPKQWLSMTDLGGAVGAWAVHSRVSDLRKEWGMNILNRREKVNGRLHSYYWYEP